MFCPCSVFAWNWRRRLDDAERGTAGPDEALHAARRHKVPYKARGLGPYQPNILQTPSAHTIYRVTKVPPGPFNTKKTCLRFPPSLIDQKCPLARANLYLHGPFTSENNRKIYFTVKIPVIK